jgi:hypothetical protein
MHPSDSSADYFRRARAESDRISPRPPMDTPQENVAAVVAALSDCRSALERNLAGLREDGPRRSALESVRVHLASFAAVTAEHEVPPERMVVMLKRMVRDLPTVRPWRDTERALAPVSVLSYFVLPAAPPRAPSGCGEPSVEIPFRELSTSASGLTVAWPKTKRSYVLRTIR